VFAEITVLLRFTCAFPCCMPHRRLRYARVLCALVDVPVYDSVPESLHLVFALYTAFKENPHFAARSKANQAQNNNNGNGGGGGPGSSSGGQQGSRSSGGGQVMNVDGADVFSLE